MALPDFALCVGINLYPGLTPLSGAEYDAKAFHDWVTGAGGVAPPRDKLILSSQYPVAARAFGAQPADKEIWEFFEMIRDEANQNNAAELGLVAGRRLYMFFSGHGFSPSLDRSGVLMANAEQDTPHNLSAKAWADRFYENGLFEEVLLFQDACRERVDDVDLTPPYLKLSPAGGAKTRKRFYAFAAKSPLLAVEKDIGGQVRGVFSATLMEGLGGGARDPKTGAISSADLKLYLVANMAARLSPQERDQDEIADEPDVYDQGSFVIVPAAPAGAAAVAPGGGATASGAPLFPVEVALPAPGAGAQILDHARAVVKSVGPNVSPWQTALPLGLFELVTPGQPGHLFRVMGAVGADGNAEVVHVP